MLVFISRKISQNYAVSYGVSTPQVFKLTAYHSVKAAVVSYIKFRILRMIPPCSNSFFNLYLTKKITAPYGTVIFLGITTLFDTMQRKSTSVAVYYSVIIDIVPKR